MDKLLSMINDKSYLIVCDNNDAIKYLIKKTNNYFRNKLVDISYITFNELSSKLNFVKSDDIILTVMDAFNLSYDIANLYIDNILQTNYLMNNNCDNDKLVKIYEIKKFLEEMNLYKKDELINHYLSNKEIIVYSLYLDEFKKYLLKDINYTFISCFNENIQEVKADILKFKTIDEEIAYTCEDIIDKLKAGINKKDIYLVCESSDYLYTLKRISKYFNLDFDIQENVSLMSIKFVRNLVDKYFENKFDELDISKFNKEESSLYKQVITIINKYVKYSDKLYFKEFLLNKIQCTKKKYECNVNSINVISINEALYLSKEKANVYIYILGMYQGNIPKIKKDEDYYSDVIKKEYKIFDSSLINTNNQNVMKEIINNFNNINLSFSKNSNFNEYIISSIVNVINANVIKKDFYISKYSHLYNKEMYYKKYDVFSKYGNFDDYLGSLNVTYNDNSYGSYDNKFKGLNYKDVLNLLDNKLNLSYTSMDQYNKCAFAYYLKYILKINDFKGNFSLFIGNVYHYVLEMHFKNKDFDFEREYNFAFEKESESYQLSACEVLLMKKFKEELKDVIKYLDEQLKSINYKNSEYEKYVKIESKLNYNGHIVNTKFDGKIDKMLYKKVELDNGEDATLVAIVDYKTSTNITFQIELVAYGLSLQLPVYAYLADNMDNMDNVIVGALFIQPILSSELIKSQKNEDAYLKAKNAIRRMQGCYNFDLDGDNEFIDSSMITKSKALNTDDIKGFVETVKYTIDETFNNIAGAKFNINPKKVDGKEYSCLYCEFADVCYRREANYEQISLKKEDKNA